jgi:transposase-like protein
MAVMISGKQFWLWRAVESKGEVLGLLVQRLRNKALAIELMRKLLKNTRPARSSAPWRAKGHTMLPRKR